MTEKTAAKATRKPAAKAKIEATTAPEAEKLVIRTIADVRAAGTSLGLNLPAKGKLSVETALGVIAAASAAGRQIDLSEWTGTETAIARTWRVTARYDEFPGTAGEQYSRVIDSATRDRLIGSGGKRGATSHNSWVRALAALLTEESAAAAEGHDDITPLLFDYRLFEAANVTALDADGNEVKRKNAAAQG